MKKIKIFIPYLVLLMMMGTIGACGTHKDEKEVTRKTTTIERPVVEEKKTTTTIERPVVEQKKTTTTTIERD